MPGVDAIHVSTGSSFPHPMNPAGSDLPLDVLSQTYEQLVSSGSHTLRNLLFFRGAITGPLFKHQWLGAGVPPDRIEGLNLPGCPKDQAGCDCTCGLHRRISDCFRYPKRHHPRATAMPSPSPGRSSPTTTSSSSFAAGKDRADKPCTYCNKCLVHVVEHPLGCYEESRFASRDEMMAQSDVGLFRRRHFHEPLVLDRFPPRPHRDRNRGGRLRHRALGAVSGRDGPSTTYESITDHFKYGSIGSEPGVSLLRPVGGVLPPAVGVHGAAVDLSPRSCPGG
jgi:hypothetical protein